jgi:CRISPR-associated protein Csy2
MTEPRIATTAAPDGLLLLPHLRVQNANAVSSPLTWGFPAPTAFLGFAHALERKLADRFGQRFDGVGIVCHHFQAQTFKPNRRQHRVFAQSRNPVYLKRDAAKFIADGTPAAIVEEGRIHLEVSLLIAVHGGFDEPLEEGDFAEAAMDTALGMRLAGGSVLPPDAGATKARWIGWPQAIEDQRTTFRHLRRRLLPGFALVHRPDVLAERLTTLQAGGASATVLDALLDLTGLNHFPVLPGVAEGEALATADKIDWQIERRPGWLVPLPSGYAGISDLHAPGTVANARDATVPFRFVESLISLGQWIGPHRLTDLEELLWRHGGDPQTGLYRTTNRYAEALTGRAPITGSTQTITSQGT